MIVSRRKLLKIAAPALLLGPKIARAQVPSPWNSGKFTWPAGRKAGINWAHPAAKGLRFSAVPAGDAITTGDGAAIDLTTGALNAIAGGSQSNLSLKNDAIGPTITTGAASASLSWSGKPAVTDANWLSACIYRIDDGSQDGGQSDFSWLSLAASNSNSYFGIAINQILIQSAPSFALEGPALAYNTAYFLAASLNATSISWLALNLQNGNLQAGTDTGFATTASDGTYTIGLARGNIILGRLAATMYSARFMTVEQLIAWAADPWSFWYPPNPVMAQLVGTTPTGQAPTLPMTGFGQ